MTDELKPTIRTSVTSQTVLWSLLVVASFLIGSLYTKVQYLKKATSTTANSTAPQPAQAGQPPENEVGEVAKITDRDHVRGSRSAQVAIIEYSDTECPFCKRFHPTAQQAVDEYKGKVMWVYRHFPLDFHANAQKEAEASECAYELGGHDAFWKYIDAIFERTTSNGTGFSLDQLVPLAKELGLPDTKFKDCFDGGKYTKYVRDEMAGGTKAGVTGTPGNIILNIKTGKARMLPGAVPLEQVKQVIDEALKG